MEREPICSNVYLSTAPELRTLWIERLTPQNENREEAAWGGLVTSPRDVAPSPRSSPLDLSPPGHLGSITLWKPQSAVFLHCTVSVIKSVHPR